MVITDCAADALVVGLTSKQPKHHRGSILTMAYACRFITSCLGSVAVSLLYNGPGQGGNFSFSLTLSQLWLLAGAPVALALLTVLPTLKEHLPTSLLRSTRCTGYPLADPLFINSSPSTAGSMASAGSVAPVGTEPKSMWAALSEFYHVLHRPSCYRTGWGLVLVNSLCLVSNNAQTEANVEWFSYDNLQAGLDNTLSYLILAALLYLLQTYCLQWSWRTMWIGAIIGMQVFELAYLGVIYFPWMRNGWVFDFIDLDSQVACKCPSAPPVQTLVLATHPAPASSPSPP